MPTSRPAPKSSPADGLPQRIAAIRRQLNLSQLAFAARIGVSRNVVSRYEGAKHRPSVGTLDRIAAIGGVTAEWLLHGRGRRGAPQHDTAWEEAVELLQAVWREPGRRATVLSLLKALRPPERA